MFQGKVICTKNYSSSLNKCIKMNQLYWVDSHFSGDRILYPFHESSTRFLLVYESNFGQSKFEHVLDIHERLYWKVKLKITLSSYLQLLLQSETVQHNCILNKIIIISKNLKINHIKIYAPIHLERFLKELECWWLWVVLVLFEVLL